MTEQTRRWFQIHLSTAVVLMFLAGGLLWANLTPRIEKKEGFPRALRYGWPQEACRIPQEAYTIPVAPYTVQPGAIAWKSGGLAIDSILALTMLVVVAAMCEALIRRREPRTQ